MAEFGDIAKEFHKLPTGGKIFFAVAIVGAAGVGFYEYQKSKSGVSGVSSPSTDTQSAQGYPTVPGSGQGSVPVLPGGMSPIFDPLGNLIGWQPTPTTGGTTTTPPPSPSPDGGGGGSGSTYNIWQPLLAPGTYKGPSYSNLKWGTTYTYNGTTYQLGTGPGGRLWGVPVTGNTTLTPTQWQNTPIAQGKKVLITEPTSAYPSVPPPTIKS